MKAYITYGIGYGRGRVLAEANAQMDAGINKVKIVHLESLTIPRCEIVENKKELLKLTGEFTGIVLQNCAKSDVFSALAFGITEDAICIGKGKAAGGKAEKEAIFEAKKAAGNDLESLQQIVAHAPYRKDEYCCAIVALVLVK
ncbi:MAG: pyruvoyl-dependent arginine decarboxylase [archaeon]